MLDGAGTLDGAGAPGVLQYPAAIQWPRGYHGWGGQSSQIERIKKCGQALEGVLGIG